MKTLKKLSEYFDDLGFIGHKDPGGLEFGDATQRTGTFWVANFLLNPEQTKNKSDDFADILDSILLETTDKRGQKKLQYVRHHDRTKWWGQPWVMSRDNLTPMLVATLLLAPFNLRVLTHLELMLTLLRKRFGFTWNYKHIWPKPQYEPKPPDLIAPWRLFEYYIRGFRKWYFYPFLLISDFDTLVNSVIRVVQAHRDPTSTSDDKNHQVRLAYKLSLYPTPAAWLAKLVYRLRPTSANRYTGGERFKGMSGPQSVWPAYFALERDPPMQEVWWPVIKKYL